MRIGIIGFMHESNTFIAQPTTLADFEQNKILCGQPMLDHYRKAKSHLTGFIQGLEAQKITPIPLLAAGATPSGKVTDHALQTILSMIITELENAGPLDGLLVGPHGAAVSEKYDDMDGYWLTKVREKVGPKIPIICVLDPHCGLSDAMLSAVNATITYRTNPHVDQLARGLEAAKLMGRTLRGEIKLTQAASLPPVLINLERQNTSAEPCLQMYEYANEILKRPGVLSNSVVLGFPYSDVKETGSGFVVVTDNDPELARKLADELGDFLIKHRQDFTGQFISPEDSVKQAIAQPGPVCLLDMGDNVGGGGVGDSTHLVHAIIEHGQKKPSFACLFDPKANELARAAGVGSRLTLSMGGHTDRQHGKPVEAAVTVLGVYDGKYEDQAIRHGGQTSYNMQPCSVVRTDHNVTILLTSVRHGQRSIVMLTSCNIEPADFQILIAKGVQAPIAAYAPVCKALIRVNTPGLTSADMSTFTFHKRRKPLFPFEEIV